MTYLENRTRRGGHTRAHDSKEIPFTNRHSGGLTLEREGLERPLLGHFCLLYPQERTFTRPSLDFGL